MHRRQDHDIHRITSSVSHTCAILESCASPRGWLIQLMELVNGYVELNLQHTGQNRKQGIMEHRMHQKIENKMKTMVASLEAARP